MKVVLSIVCCMLCFGSVFAQTNDELKKENSALKERVADLEARMSKLETMVSQTSSEKRVDAAIAATDGKESAYHQLKSGFFGKKGAKFDIYGYAKLDMAYDDSRTKNGNLAYYAYPETYAEDDDQFTMTANQTRLGLNIDGPTVDGLDVDAKVEVDFYGGGNENQAHIRMRHAYINATLPNYNLSILAGQTWDLIAQQTPATLNFGVLNFGGNMGYRRPQLRVTKWWDIDEGKKLEVAAAISRQIGDSNSFAPSDTGADSGYPALQGRVAYSQPLWTSKPALVAVGGHIGRDEVDIDSDDSHDTVDSWSAVVELSLPITEKIRLYGEAFMGRALGQYRAGGGYGTRTDMSVSPYAVDGVSAKGGFVALQAKATDKLTINLGAGTDDPNDDDLLAGDRGRNTIYFGNLTYDVTKSLKLGLEVMHLDTQYVGDSYDDGDALRFQSSIIYAF